MTVGDVVSESPLPARIMQPAKAARADGSARPGKAQKQFNDLIARIAAQRRELAEWQVFVPTYHRIVADSIDPLAAKLRERRVVLVKLLDRAVAAGELTRREQAKAQDILLDQLRDLLREAADAALLELHDAHSDVGFRDLPQRDAEALRPLAEATPGVGDSDSVDDRAHAGPSSSRRQRSMKDRTEGAESAARAALYAKAVRNGSHAMREVYRKLASELHPDRELEPGEQVRKTVLMQQANQAYDARDLVGLLELQLRIEQIAPQALTDMARARLGHFNHVLREQSQRLQEELAELTGPFMMAMGGLPPRRFTPDVVRQALHTDVRALRLALKELEADIADFRDIRRLKGALKAYRGGR